MLSRIKSHILRPEPCKQLLQPSFYANESCGMPSENTDLLISSDSYSTIELNLKLNPRPDTTRKDPP